MARWFTFVAMLGSISPAWSVEPKDAKQDFTSVTKALAEAAQPSDEVQKLQPLAGNWNYTCKMWMDPNQPPMESKGTIQRKWILGGRFLEEKVTGTSFDGASDFEGCGIVGYDTHQKKFTMSWISTMATSISTATGTYDSADRKFTFNKEEFCPIRQRNIKARDVIRIESDDKNVMEVYDLDNGGEKKVMEVVAVRQK